MAWRASFDQYMVAATLIGFVVLTVGLDSTTGFRSPSPTTPATGLPVWKAIEEPVMGMGSVPESRPMTDSL